MEGPGSTHAATSPFGVTLLPGRVTDPAQSLQDAENAERLGFNRVWLSERYDLKEAAVLCGAFAARTSSIGIATGLVVDAVRHPLMAAAFGATMQATFGDRFTMGMSRGVATHLRPQGFDFHSLQGFEDYVTILRRLWAGERVEYDGPLGRLHLEFVDKLRGPAPKVVYGNFANAKAAEIAARTFDGVLLVPFMTAEAVARAVRRLREAAERIGRDPATLTISHYIVSAPDLPAADELAIVNARAVTYLQMPGFGDLIVAANGWDPEVVRRLREHPALSAGRGKIADLAFHRSQLFDVAATLPDEWMRDGAALGTARDCCRQLERFFATGVDEIVFQGTSPRQNEELMRIWRQEHQGVPAQPGESVR